MSSIVLLKLVAIFAVIGLGWGAGKARVLGDEAARTLSNSAFYLFAPALLFRTTAKVALGSLPWTMLAAYYVPTAGLLLLVYRWQRTRTGSTTVATIRALSTTFSNTLQLGVPVVTALFGSTGLAILIALISLQALVLLTIGTVLVESGLARDRKEQSGAVLKAAGSTLRRTLVHPVVLPVLLGLAYNATRLPIPGPLDDVLTTLAQAVVPVSLVTIGLSLRQHGVAGSVRPAVALSAGKLLGQPAVVFAVAYGLVGLRGLPLTIAVLCAGLPIGSNVLLFAQRYRSSEEETTAAIVASTITFLATGTLWLLLLSRLEH